MEVSTAICAQSVIIDRFSNQVSLINLRTQLRAVTFPYWIPEISFVVILEKEDGDPETYETFATVTLNGEEISRTTVIITFKGGRGSRQILNFSGLPVTGPGLLKFILTLPNERFACAKLPVSLRQSTS